MKKIKKLLLIVVCCAFTLTMINIPDNYEISSHGHHSQHTEDD